MKYVGPFLWQMLIVLGFLGVAPPPALAEQPTRYMIVVTGSELLAGAFPDGHTHFITRTLRPLGLQCVGSMTVDDGKDDIRQALEYATGRAPLVLVTGGLGPTVNDVTCEAISEFTGVAVREHPDVLAAVARRFRTPVAQLRANLRRQTRVPLKGSYLANSVGTAVGLVFEPGNGVVVALPGPPRELQPMVTHELVPLLSRRFGTRLPGSSLTVRFVGLGQSTIDQILKEHVPLAQDIVVSSQFDGSRVDFTFALPEENGENHRRLDALKAQILEHLGDHVYATDADTSLERVVIGLLAERGITLAVAEIASGGSVESALGSAGDPQKVLVGAYVAPSAENLRRMLQIEADASSPKRVAQALVRSAGSRWGLVVGEPYSSEDGSPRADVLVRMDDGATVVRSIGARRDTLAGRARMTTQIIEHLRKQLVDE